MINFQVNQMCRFQIPHASAIQIRVKMKILVLINCKHKEHNVLKQIINP